MNIAVISDTHFGDTNSMLVEYDSNGQWVLTDKYFNKFLACLKHDANNKLLPYKYLVILGDVFELAVSGYKQTYRAAKVFFSKLQTVKAGPESDQPLFEEIIIVTGNHDHTLWTNLQYMDAISSHIDDPQPVRWSVPGFLDNRNKKCALTGDYYSDSFLNGLTGKDPEEQTHFIIMCPNLYYLFKDGNGNDKTLLFTHGHYFNTAWAVLGEIAAKLFPDDLYKTPLSRMDHILGDNFLLNQFTCSGLGQSETNFTAIIQHLEHELSAGNVYYLIERILNLFDLSGFMKKALAWLLSEIIESILSAKTDKERIDYVKRLKKEIPKKRTLTLTLRPEDEDKENGLRSEINDFYLDILKHLENPAQTGNGKIQVDTPAFSLRSAAETETMALNAAKRKKKNESERAGKYREASLEELKALSDARTTVADIDYIICGHTHKPVPWNKNAEKNKVDWKRFSLNSIPNTGCWLFTTDKNGCKVPCGANVFSIDTDTDTISYANLAGI